MLRKLFKLIGSLVMIAFLTITVAFTSHESKNITCADIEVSFNSNDMIKLSQDEVIRLVKSVDKEILGKALDQINAEVIEEEVEKHQAILNAEVYKVVVKDTTSYKGILTVVVKHKKPVVRIMSSNGNYYLDKLGGKIPVSSNYSANVLVATGSIGENFASNELLPFILFIEEDKFWEAQIEQVHVENDGDVILIPLVGDQIIELGTLENYEEKLRNMKAFYEQVLAENNWDKYKSVSLKYKNQVIAKRR